MATIYETGHVINIGNFKKIIDRCLEFGTSYNPVNTEISIANMTAKWTAVSLLHDDYYNDLEATKIPINEREILFEKLKKIVVRSVNLYKSTGASKRAVMDARGLMYKITGWNTKIRRNEEGVPDPKQISNSQQSYLKKIDHFDQLIKFYENDTHYDSNENSLKITGLKALMNDIKTLNNDLGLLIASATLKRIDRDRGLYEANTGLVDISLSCKNYVKSLYGAKSPEAKSVVSIPIRRVMKLDTQTV